MSNNYFKNKEINKMRAINHTNIMKDKYSKDIQYSIDNTKEYRGKLIIPHNENIIYTNNIKLECMMTQDAIMNIPHTGKVAALNFASYKNAGGMFLEGSSAQEESLCHHSTLFNVLQGYDSISDYYKYNRKHLNRGLYTDACLYSPDIIFDNGDKCDIITCAAPNLGPVLKYNNASSDEIFTSIYNRCKFILDVAILNNVDSIILGAFGCGVFKNDPAIVASAFRNILYHHDYRFYFKNVIFAIPAGENYNKFDIAFNCL